MDFMISCDVFFRLAQVIGHFKPSTDQDLVKKLSCVRLEYKNNRYYAIVTNKEIAAIQYLGTTEQPDHAIHLTVNERLINQIKNEIPYDSFLIIETIPGMAVTTLTTTLGYRYNDDPCIYPDETPMDNWKDWFPDKLADANRGIMFWNADHVAALAASAPSGKIFFPKFIDVNKPIIIRDTLDDSWCGLFIPKPDFDEPQVNQGAEMPKWL